MTRQLQVIFTNKGVYTYNGYEDLPVVCDVIKSDIKAAVAYGYVCKDYNEYVKHITDYLEKCYNINNKTFNDIGEINSQRLYNELTREGGQDV